AGEAPETAGARELEEETGYRADEIENCGRFFSSPGMTSESFTLLKATELEKVSEGGGTGHEDITVHRVRIAGIADFISSKRAEGCAIDVRLLLLLGAGMLGR
ncbi:MAG: NUDIX hydrolase, partial [Sphingomonadales bacterium]|nr:NUDIX hydrolase [Sphingomonadales bacterium]